MTSYEVGYEDGLNARPYNNPYEEGSTEYLAYDSGYNNGQLVGDVR